MASGGEPVGSFFGFDQRTENQMRFLRIGTLGIFAVATALPAFAQAQLTKAEAGRAAVGQCYSRCMADLYEIGQDVVAQQERLLALALQASDALFLDESFADVLTEYTSDALCLSAQNYVRFGDACQSGCVDVEASWGVRSSGARARYNFEFARDRDILADAGLWGNFRTSPAIGTTAFRRACNAFVASQSAPGTLHSRLLGHINSTKARAAAASPRQGRLHGGASDE